MDRIRAFEDDIYSQLRKMHDHERERRMNTSRDEILDRKLSERIPDLPSIDPLMFGSLSEVGAGVSALRREASDLRRLPAAPQTLRAMNAASQHGVHARMAALVRRLEAVAQAQASAKEQDVDAATDALRATSAVDQRVSALRRR